MSDMSGRQRALEMYREPVRYSNFRWVLRSKRAHDSGKPDLTLALQDLVPQRLSRRDRRCTLPFR